MNRNRTRRANVGTVLSVSEPNSKTDTKVLAARINNREGSYKREHHFFSFVVLLFLLSGIP